MTRGKALWCGLALAAVSAGCFEQESRMKSAGAGRYEDVALEFTNALASRDYAAAYRMTSSEYRARTTADQMRLGFEAIVPSTWKTVGPVEVGHTMEDWPDKQPADAGWAYVSVGGDVYSEAVTLIVTREDDTLKVRSAEFGRP